MRLLVLCPHFTPDVAPTGEVMTRIADELTDLGHELHVVTALPWYLHHRVEPGWGGRLVRREQLPGGGSVTRVHPFPTDKRNIPARALAFGGFTAVATAVALTDRHHPHAVLAMSPPLPLGVAGLLIARRHRVPLVFNIQDVFPDVAIELGVLENRWLIEAARRLERFSYRHADAVTVLSDDLAANVRQKLGRHARRGDGSERVRVIPNFVDVDRIAPADKDNDYRSEFGLTGKRVVMYAGNVGFSQSLDLVLAAAEALAGEEDLRFVINGGGSALEELERRAADLPNVVFVGLQPRERLPEVLAAADLHVVPLRRGLARSSVPSKLYSILAAGRPIVASVDSDTEVARTVGRAEAGLAVPPDDPDAFVKAVRQLLDQPDRAAAMGEAGRRFVEGWASPAAVAAAYERLFRELGGDFGPGRSPD